MVQTILVLFPEKIPKAFLQLTYLRNLTQAAAIISSIITTGRCATTTTFASLSNDSLVSALVIVSTIMPGGIVVMVTARYMIVAFLIARMAVRKPVAVTVYVFLEMVVLYLPMLMSQCM